MIYKLIDKHPGVSCRNGGEYGFYRWLVPTKDGKYRVYYETTAEAAFPYCPVCGEFYSDQVCPYHDTPQYLTEEQVKTLLERFPSRTNNSQDIIVIDCTGHTFEPSDIKPGCVICYP